MTKTLEDEPISLKTLRRLGRNEELPLRHLDAVCRLVTEHFRLPIAVISLIDGDIQVFVGRHGTQSHAAPGQDSISSHAVPDDGVLVVEDARGDPRFAACPLVAVDPRIRFYAGVPLMHASGMRLGTLFVAAQWTATFDHSACEALKTFGDLAAAKLSHWESELRADAQKRDLVQQQTVLAHAQDLASLGMWEWDLESDQIQWSDSLTRLFDSSPAELDTTFGQFIDTVVHPDDRARVEDLARAARQQGRALNTNFRILRADDGRERILASRGDVIKENGRPVRVVGVVQDISERHRSEAALRASEARWSLALKAGRMVAFDLELATGAVILSDHAGEVLGFTTDLYTEFFDAIHAEDRELVESTMEQAAAAKSLFQVEFRLVRPDGRVVWISQSGGPAEGTVGEARHLTGVCIDVTEQKNLQHSLQASEERARGFAEVSSDWLWETDENLRFTLVLGGPEDARYEGASTMLGKTRWEYAGADPDSQPWKDHIYRHTQLLPFRDFEYEVRDETGGLRWVSASGQPVFDAKCRFRGYRGTASDQTSAKRLEAKLQESQRTEALGQLSGGVAHDFNNLLTIIMGNAEVLVDRLASDAGLRPLAALIQSAAERGADLTDRLLAYARRQTLEPVSISVNAAVERMAGILQRSVGEHIHLELSLADDLHWAHVDAALLESTILNLAVNARDAMPQGGTMTITTRNLVVDSVTADELRDLTPGDYVEIGVMDTGAGMAPDILQRAFEPFFTTKEVGKGSGLGLAMAQGFASQSGGQIALQSSLGCGTRISLVLPRSTSVPLTRDELAETGGLKGGRERILVVEDEPDVRRFVVSQLASLGYETAEAGDGPSALAVLHSSRAFDLLFTDVVLPMHMNGLELAAQATSTFPQLKVLFSSGYSAQISAFADLRELGAMLLFKPYRRQELATMVRQAIDA